MSRLLEKSIFWLIAFLLCFLPFHAFGVTSLNFLFFEPGTSPYILLSLWKEFAVVFLCLLLCLYFLVNRRFPFFDVVDAFIVLLFIHLGIVTFFNSDLSQPMAIMASVKYSFYFLGLFFLLKHYPFYQFEKRYLVQFLYMSTIAVVVFGLMLQFFDGYEILTFFGYYHEPSVYFGDRPIAYCQLIEGTNICRNQSVFAGPNQYASFLLIVFPIVAAVWVSFLFDSPKNILHKYIIHPLKKGVLSLKESDWTKINRIDLVMSMFIMGLTFLSLITTFTRSAWIGVSLAILFGSYFFISKEAFRKVLIGMGVLMAVVISGIFLFQGNDLYQKIIVRVSSSGGHYEKLIESIEIIQENPMGYGLGAAGASSRFSDQGKELISENWFLQIAIEVGLFGLLLYLLIFIYIGWRFIVMAYITRSLFHSLICVSVVISLFSLAGMGMMLHVFEDAATAVTFWILAGLMYHDI